MRCLRLVMMVFVAAVVVAVPTALAQTPAADQYETISAPAPSVPIDDATRGRPSPDEAGRKDAGRGRAGSARARPGAPVGEDAKRPVGVQHPSTARIDSLPFAGGQISPLPLVGLTLLALGAVGLAATRGRRASEPR